MMAPPTVPTLAPPPQRQPAPPPKRAAEAVLAAAAAHLSLGAVTASEGGEGGQGGEGGEGGVSGVGAGEGEGEGEGEDTFAEPRGSAEHAASSAQHCRERFAVFSQWLSDTFAPQLASGDGDGDGLIVEVCCCPSKHVT